MGQQMIFWYCIASESSEGSGKSADSPEHLLLAFTKTSIPAGCVSVGVYYFPFFDTDDTIVWPEQTHYHSSKDKNSWVCVIHWIRVSKVAKIRNRYNQVPHLTQDTNGKVKNSQKTPQTRAKRSALSQQVTTKHI